MRNDGRNYASHENNHHGSSATHHIRRIVTKVPEITILFWIIKVLTTGMGEVTSDYLVRLLPAIVAVAIAAIGLVVALVLQVATRRYNPWIYWFSVVMVSIFGTMAADVLHVEVGIPYVASVTFFIIVLTCIFIAWYRSEKTLSVHSIYTHRRELFYWATVLATFALGTAVGDMTATTLHLGYLASGIMFAGIMIIPATMYWVFNVSEVLTFWFAYILTRPLGASFADWMGVSQQRGGLGLGTGIVSLCLTILIVGFVAYLSKSHGDVESVDLAAAS